MVVLHLVFLPLNLPRPRGSTRVRLFRSLFLRRRSEQGQSQRHRWHLLVAFFDTRPSRLPRHARILLFNQSKPVQAQGWLWIGTHPMQPYSIYALNGQSKPIMERTVGFEPTTNSLERGTGVEPVWPAWKAGAQPICQPRMVGLLGFEPRTSTVWRWHSTVELQTDLPEQITNDVGSGFGIRRHNGLGKGSTEGRPMQRG